MTRDIVFRGWDIKNNCWVYGYYEDYMAAFGPHTATIHVKMDWGLNGSFSVVPGSVGQYIGVEDSTGKRIYEGDIIQTYFIYNNTTQKDGRPKEVRWDREGTGFIPFIDGCGGCNDYAMRALACDAGYRNTEYGSYKNLIVGNTWENKKTSSEV